MILYVHIPPWGSLPVYTEAPRWPEPRRLPLPPRRLALEHAERAALERFMESEGPEDVLREARIARRLLMGRGGW